MTTRSPSHAVKTGAPQLPANLSPSVAAAVSRACGEGAFTRKPKRHKYGAKAVEIDGHKFPSKAEAKRYQELKLLERAGNIRGLELQPKFPLKVNGKLICNYYADFAYFEGERRIWEDVKGHKTREYLIKKKLVEALYPGVTITEVRA